MTKATIRLSAMASMNGALTNYLLGVMVTKNSNPIPSTARDVFKQISQKTIDNVIGIVSEKACGLTKAELAALEDLAGSHKQALSLV